MGVELLVYIYLAVCLAMIFFNIATIIISKRREKANEKRRALYTSIIRQVPKGLPNITEPDSFSSVCSRKKGSKHRHPPINDQYYYTAKIK